MVMQSMWFLLDSIPGTIHVCFGLGYASGGPETLPPDTQLFKVKFTPYSGDL